MARVPDCGFRGIPDSRCRRRAHEPFPKSGARAQMASADIVGFHRVPQTELLPKAEANDPRRKFRRTQHGDPTPIEACSSGRFSRGGGRQALWVLLLRHAFTHRAALDGATVRQGPQTPLPSSRPGGLDSRRVLVGRRRGCNLRGVRSGVTLRTSEPVAVLRVRGHLRLAIDSARNRCASARRRRDGSLAVDGYAVSR